MRLTGEQPRVLRAPRQPSGLLAVRISKMIGRKTTGQPDGPAPGVFHSRVRDSGSVGMVGWRLWASSDLSSWRRSDAGLHVRDVLDLSSVMGTSGLCCAMQMLSSLSPGCLDSFTLKVRQTSLQGSSFFSTLGRDGDVNGQADPHSCRVGRFAVGSGESVGCGAPGRQDGHDGGADGHAPKPDWESAPCVSRNACFQH